MAAPKRTRKTSTGRLYEWKPPGTAIGSTPERYWSVTTIIKGSLPTPALIGWGIKSVAEYAVANHRQLSSMLQTVKLQKTKDEGIYVVSDPDAVESATKWLKGSPYRERDRKAALGTSVHEHAEAYQKGRPFPPARDDVRPYVESFHKFLDDFNPEMELAEASVYNRTLKYAGTLDNISIINDERILLDFKTGKGVYPEAALQLAAYRYAEFIGMPDGSEAKMPEVDGAAVVHLREDGYELIPVVADENVFNSFRYCIEVFRWVEEISKNVIGQAIVPEGKASDAPA